MFTILTLDIAHLISLTSFGPNRSSSILANTQHLPGNWYGSTFIGVPGPFVPAMFGSGKIFGLL